MKALLLALLTLGFASTGLAANKACKSAKIETLNDDKPQVTVTYKRDISLKSNAQVASLPTPVKQKMIVFAKGLMKAGYYASDRARFGKPSDIKSTVDAVEFIRQINENRKEEMMYKYITGADGEKFVQITIYPGAQVGEIYPIDRLSPVATISDGDVRCN